MNAPLPQPTLLSSEGQPRMLSAEQAAPVHRATDLVASLAMGRWHRLALEAAGRAAALGYIERTPTGIHLHLVEPVDQAPIISLTAGTDADAAFALGKHLQGLHQRMAS